MYKYIILYTCIVRCVIGAAENVTFLSVWMYRACMYVSTHTRMRAHTQARMHACTYTLMQQLLKLSTP